MAEACNCNNNIFRLEVNNSLKRNIYLARWVVACSKAEKVLATMPPPPTMHRLSQELMRQASVGCTKMWEAAGGKSALLPFLGADMNFCSFTDISQTMSWLKRCHVILDTFLKFLQNGS